MSGYIILVGLNECLFVEVFAVVMSSDDGLV